MSLTLRSSRDVHQMCLLFSSCRSPQRGVARWHPEFVHCLQVQRWHYGCIVTISSTVSADLPFAVTRCCILWFLKLCNLTLKVAFVVSPMLEGLSARRSAVRPTYAGTCVHGRRAIHSHQVSCWSVSSVRTYVSRGLKCVSCMGRRIVVSSQT